ncbi:MAG: helix-turn-helix domain-containing protein [Candidatus Bathyarchaeota archaeon]|nr:helix-turn-helix domain-containing protein [Candidatus Bathyarchaeota archaeon]
MFPKINEISKKRKMLGLTQNELAKLSGVSQSLIAKLESGKIEPSYTKVKTIFENLNRLEVKSKIKANRIDYNKVVSVQENELVSQAVVLMKKYGYSQLPVLKKRQVVGSISEKTILNQILAGRFLDQISKLQIKEVMEESLPQVNEDAPLSLISSLLQVYSAVLISNKGDVKGIITKADFLKLL